MPDPLVPPAPSPQPASGAAEPTPVVLWSVQAGAPAPVPPDQVDAAISSGNFFRYSGTTEFVRPAGGREAVPVTPERALQGAAVGESREFGAQQARQAAEAHRKEAFDTWADGALAFQDGFYDFASMGLLHQRGEQGEILREEHPGKEFLGSAAAALLPTGEAGLAAKGAEGAVKAAGKLFAERAAEAVIGQAGRDGVAALRGAARAAGGATPLGLAERGLRKVAAGIIPEGAAGSRGAVLARGAREALVQAGIGAGYDVGHQAADALLDDKPFAYEHVANSAKVGGLLGFGFGAGGAALTRVVERESAAAALADKDGLVNPDSPLSRQVHGHFEDAVGAWDQALAKHEADLVTLKALVKHDALPGFALDLVAQREAPLAAARRIRAQLGKLDLSKAAGGSDPQLLQKYASLLEAYGAAVNEVDRVMRPSDYERAHLFKPGPEADPSELVDTLLRGEAPQPSTAERVQAWRDLAETRVPSGETEIGSAPASSEISRATRPSPRVVSPEEWEAFRAAREAGPATLVQGEETGIYERGQPEVARGPEESAAPPEAGTRAGKRILPRDTDLTPEYETPEARLRDTRVLEPPRPELPAVLREAEGNRARVVLEDGREMWKSEYRKIQKEHQAALRAWESERAGGLEGQLRASVAERGQLGEPTGIGGPVTSAGREPAAITRELPGRAEERVTGQLPRPTEELPTPYEARTQEMPDRATQAQDRVRLEPQTAPRRSSRGAYEWFMRLGQEPRGPSPGHVAAQKIQAHLDALRQLAGPRLTASSVLEVARAAGIPDAPRGPLARQLVNLWGIRRLAREAAKEGPRAGRPGYLARKLQGYALGAAGFHAAGPLGGAVGAALGFSGHLAGSVAAAKQAIIRTAEKMLAGRRAGLAAKVLTHTAYAPPEGYSYDGGPPEPDLRARVEKLRLAASDEGALRMRIRNSLGDTRQVLPDAARAAEDVTVSRLQALSAQAPAWVWMGNREAGPSLHDERRFREAEAATWEPDYVLDAAASGQLTDNLARTFRTAHPEAARILAGELLAHPDKLKTLPGPALRQVELVTGLRLTPGADPAYVLRQQAQSTSSQSPSLVGPKATGKPQALKIEPPTPSQAQVAPGN